MSVSNAAMAPAAPRGIDLAIALAAVAAIVGAILAGPAAADGWRWLHWVCKPLATLLILYTAWRAAPPISVDYRRWMVAGMTFSLAGDIFLMLPADTFVAGLVAFLLGHLCFLHALLAGTRSTARSLALLACLAYGAINLWALWPSLPDALHLPVVVYVAVLASMAGQATARARRHAHDALAKPARWAAVGALLFMLSDTLLAWNRFRLAIPLSALWILATYYAALWCLARSVHGMGKHT